MLNKLLRRPVSYRSACLAAAAAFLLVIMGPGIDWCQVDWVKNSEFWSFYFNCN